MIRPAIVVACLCALPGCTAFPEVDAAMNARTGETTYPALLPLGGLLTGPETRLDADSGARLAARAAALRRKAARLSRAPVLSTAERRRLLQAAQRHAKG